MSVETREFRISLLFLFKQGLDGCSEFWIKQDNTWAVNSLSPLGAESRGLVERIQHKGQPNEETEKDENFRAKFISPEPLKQDQ